MEGLKELLFIKLKVDANKSILDDIDIRMLKYRITEHGSAKSLMEQILHELDATLVLPDGSRPRQTISYVWQKTDASFFWLIDYLADNGMTNEEYKDYISRRAAIIDNNLKFEEENPPIIYSNTKKRSTTKKVKAIVDDKSNIDDDKNNTKVKKDKKPSAAEIRKNRVISTATFNFNIIKNK